jgi:hypothetical protein
MGGDSFFVARDTISRYPGVWDEKATGKQKLLKTRFKPGRVKSRVSGR